MAKYEQHPLSAAFPQMDEPDFLALIADIEKTGLKQDIIVIDRQIVDGWHRYRACLETGVKPRFRKLPADADPVAYVLSCNLHRRHLTGSQRASAVVACAEWAPPHRPEKVEVTSTFSTNEEMAKIADVSEKTIQQAKRAQEAGLGEALRDGKLTAERAAEIAKLPEDERQAALEAPKEKSKPEPKPKEDESEIQRLKNENKILQERLEGLIECADEINAQNAVLTRIADADDQVKQAAEEVSRINALNHTLQTRVNGLMAQVYEITKDAKRWKRRAEAAERKLKAAAIEPDPEPTAENPYVDDATINEPFGDE